MLHRITHYLFKRRSSGRNRGGRNGRARGASKANAKPVKALRRKRHVQHTPWQTAKAWFAGTSKKLGFAFGAVCCAWILWMFLALPSVQGMHAAKNPGIVIRDDKGAIISSYGDVYGQFLPFEKLPKNLIEAVLATEDRNFYHHFGFDPMGLARAMWVNFQAGKVVQGGSTITQQVAKNLFLSSERTFARKLRELFMSMKLEASFSKEEILAIYLNRVYLGAGNFGVDAACRRYFGKAGQEMTLPEAAVLTGLLKAPSRLAPTSNPHLAEQRARQVLINMVDAGYLTEAKQKKATAELSTLLSQRLPDSPNSYYFSDWLVDTIPDYIGDITQDIEVYSTMDDALQNNAEKAIQAAMEKEGATLGVSQAALLAMAPDGAVKAMMGGVSYSKSQYNRATQAQRQPGSSFKLFVYLNALEQGAYPDMMVEDQPIQIGKWSPGNYNGKYLGMMSLRDAVTQSINTVAVQMSEAYGRNNVVAMARSLGVASPLEPTPSIALGAYEVTLMEVVTAYAHLAAGGMAVQPYGIQRIVTRKGEVLYERKNIHRKRVLSTTVVGMANDMFSSVIGWGTGARANIGRPAAGKTGTTSDYKDAWFVGYTPDLVAGVWVGNDTPKAMKKVTGGNLPAGIWRDFMRPALAGVPANKLPIASRPVEAGSNLPWSNEGSGFIGSTTGMFDRRRGDTDININQQPKREPRQREEAVEDPVGFTPSFWDALGIR